MELNCLYCGKEFHTYPSIIKKGNGKYCSKSCFLKSGASLAGTKKVNETRWGNYNKKILDHSCIICGQATTIHESDLKYGRGIYCSIACRGKGSSLYHKGEKHHNWTGGKKNMICLVCGKNFLVKPEQKRRTGAKFCSLTCRSIWCIRYSSNKTNTAIENIIERLLIENNIPHKKQYTISNIAVVDFFIPDKYIVQCDGDYWHSLPKQVIKDIRQDGKLSTMGYHILRLREKEIESSTDICLRKIRELMVE